MGLVPSVLVILVVSHDRQLAHLQSSSFGSAYLPLALKYSMVLVVRPLNSSLYCLSSTTPTKRPPVPLLHVQLSYGEHVHLQNRNWCCPSLRIQTRTCHQYQSRSQKKSLNRSSLLARLPPRWRSQPQIMATKYMTVTHIIVSTCLGARSNVFFVRLVLYDAGVRRLEIVVS